MIRDITLGQYYPADSILHKLDPRVKLVTTIVFLIALFVADDWVGYLVATVFLVAIYINIQRSHTFTLSNDEGTIKTEQIQPLWGTVKVSGDCDTEVVFTDVETGEKYRIGYITQGVTERIKLERGKWYKVAGGGNLTLNPVNIRVE